MGFNFERDEILENLVLLEDRGYKLPCPIRCEKYASKVIGYAKEIAEGHEDTEMMNHLKEDMTKIREIVRTNPEPKIYPKLADLTKKWRKIIQGIDDFHCVGGHCGTKH